MQDNCIVDYIHIILVKFFGCSMLLGIKLSKMGAACKIWTDNSMLPLISLLWSIILYTCPLLVMIKYILSPSTSHLFLCVYMYIHAPGCLCMVHVHGDQRLMSSIFIFLHHSPIYFLYRALTEPGIQLSWIANSRHLFLSMSPVLWWQMHATKPSIFIWVLKDLKSDSHAWLSQSLHGPVHLIVFSLSQGHWLMT